MIPHARDVVAWVAGDVQDTAAAGLAARKLGRQEVARRFGRAVELVLAHFQVLGRPDVLKKILAHAVLWASVLDEERPWPGHPHATWWCLFCGAGEDWREKPGQEERAEDVRRKVVLMALFSRRSIFPSSCACIVEPFTKSVFHDKEVQMTGSIDWISKRPFGPSRFRKS